MKFISSRWAGFNTMGYVVILKTVNGVKNEETRVV